MSTLYGYSPRMRFDLVVNTMTKTSFLERAIHVHGGSQWRPLVHVKDAADAFVKVLESDLKLIKNKIYNVGSEGQNYRISEVAEIISKALNNTPILTKQSDTDARDYRVSFKRIQQDLGFKVNHTIEEAAKEIFKRLKSKEIKDPRQKVYYNHYFDSSEELIG
jgi:nucleoside-diphosphate-sugar epimerase